jgi:predicted phage terminase large subunit-like protein
MQNYSLREKLAVMPKEKLAFSNFAAYISINFPGYRFSRHNLLIAKALMKIEAGEMKRLIVCMPPRHGKTMQISEFFPAWYMGRNPTHQIIATAYNATRAGDVGRAVRNHMITPIHHKIFKGCTVSLDSKSVSRLATDQGGAYYSVGTGEAIVGRGANLFLIDDPIKSREEAESDTARRRLFDWYKGVAYTRLMPQNAIIAVATRWHFDDLIGRLLDEMKHENWVVLNLPAICDSEDDMLGRQIGECLWETDYPVDTLENIKVTIGTREWNAQYQQRPLPSEGGLVNIEWFQKYNWKEWFAAEAQVIMHHEEIHMPFEIRRIVMSIDTAFKESQLNDPSAITIWGETKDNCYYLLNIINKRMKYPKLKDTVIRTWQKYMKFKRGQIPVLIEDRASGQSLIQDLKRYTKIPVLARPADLNKQIRMSSVSPLIEAGRVYLPDKAPWLVEYETQMARFPLWKHDDLVDCTSQFLRWVARPQYRKNLKRKFWK